MPSIESPKYSLARGRPEKAAVTVERVATINGRCSWMRPEMLRDVGNVDSDGPRADVSASTPKAMKRKLFNNRLFAKAFADPQLKYSVPLLWVIWTAVGLAYPMFNSFLPQALASMSELEQPQPLEEVLMDTFITSCVGLLAGPTAWGFAQVPKVGRKGTMAVSALLAGVFLFLFAKLATPNTQVVYTSLSLFFQGAMYGTL